jgi:hypothetical protein
MSIVIGALSEVNPEAREGSSAIDAGHALAIFDDESQMEARLSRARLQHAPMRAVSAVER